MKRTFFVVAVLVAFATASSAATLSVVSNKTTYSVGEGITLLVNGDAEGVSTGGIFGRLEYNGALVDNVGASQKLIGTGASGWSKSDLDPGDTNANAANSAFNETFDQVNLNGGFQTATNPISTVTLIAQAVGVVNVTWNTASGSGFELNFFGLTNAPGTSFTIVPEPSTVALLGLGLVGLVLGGRRRS